MTQNTKTDKNDWLQVIGVGLTTNQASEIRNAITKKLKTDPLHTTSVLTKKQAATKSTTH